MVYEIAKEKLDKYLNFRTTITLLLLILLSCSSVKQRLHKHPTLVLYQTDTGTVWLYRNHERAEIIGPHLLISAPDTLHSDKVEYFPNGVQPESEPIHWVNRPLYSGTSSLP